MKPLVALLFVVAVFVVPADAQGWVNVTPSNPGPTVGGRSPLVFDPLHNELVAMARPSSGGHQIYTWDGVDWTQHLDTSGLTNFKITVGGAVFDIINHATGEWDPLRGQVVFFFQARNYSGLNNQPVYDYGLAGWDGQQVSFIADLPFSGSPSSTFDNHLLVFDHAANELLCLANTSSNNSSGRLYILDAAGAWILNSSLIEPNLDTGSCRPFYDWSLGRLAVMFMEGGNLRYWDYHGGQWQQHYPAVPAGWAMPSASQGIVGVPSRSETLFLDLNPGLLQPQMWSVSEREIQQRFLSSWPPLRQSYASGYDPTRGRVALHGGNNWWRDTWELDLGPTATYSTYGQGCSASSILPALAAQNGTLPSVNTQFSVQVSGLPWTAPSFMWVGLSNQSYGGYPLPLDLAFLGAPGCEVLVSPDLLYPIPNILGTGVWTLGIPNVPGFTFYNQTVSLDSSANNLGLVFSNAGEAIVGQ